MPTYEYECSTCGLVFEEFQSITAEPLKKCRREGCNGTVKRLFSPGAGFLFKGSGFYITDYRSDTYKKSAKSDSTQSTPSSGSDTSKKADSGSTGASSPVSKKE